MHISALNVGGTKFETSDEIISNILVRLKDNQYETRFRKVEFERWEPMVAIDRDPKVFGYILNYLRDGSVIIPRNGCTLAQIKKEAQFYGIKDLVEKIDEILKDFSSDYLQI